MCLCEFELFCNYCLLKIFLIFSGIAKTKLVYMLCPLEL